MPPTGRPKGENRPKGLNALGVLARYPELSRAYNVFSGQIMYGSTLSARHRELVVLRVATVRDSEYEWLQHVAAPVTTASTRTRWRASPPDRTRPGGPTSSVRSCGPSTSSWRDALIGDETWSSLAGELEERELMDLVFTVGAYDVLAMALKTFGVPLDDDLKPQ